MADADKKPFVPLEEVLPRYARWQRPFIAFEWYTERLVARLDNWALVDLLKIVGAFSIVWGALSYLMAGDARARVALDQRKAKHYQAWQVLNTAHGLTGSGGRIEALHDLVADSVALDGVALDSAWLVGADLRGMQANDARAERVNLSHAVLSGATFVEARLRSANLSYACLNGATIDGTSLARSSFRGADLRGSLIVNSILDGADLYRANLSRALIYETHVRPHGTTDRRGPPQAKRVESDPLFKNRMMIMTRSILRPDTADARAIPSARLFHQRYWAHEEDRDRLLEAWPDSQYVFYVEPSDWTGADLSDATIDRSELRHAVLDSVDLADAIIRRSDLRGVSMIGAKNWRRIKSLDSTVFNGSEQVPDGFMNFAMSKGAFLQATPSDTSRLRRTIGGYKGFIQRKMQGERPDANPHADTLARSACAALEKEQPFGGRLGHFVLNRSRRENSADHDSAPAKGQIIPDSGLYIWDVGATNSITDTTTRSNTVSERFIVENPGAKAVSATLEATAGFYRRCIYASTDPLATFIPTTRKRIEVSVSPHSLQIVNFEFGKFAQVPHERCAGTSPLRARIVAQKIE
jgi:uncharacterized protein YjbI with pentapeptide repeats